MAFEKEWNYTLDDIETCAKQLLKLCKNRYFFAFYGEVGAGKTTLIKSLCKLLGSDDQFSSPTYALVNEYSIPQATGKEKIYHIDLYRIKSFEEALDIDIESYFYDNDAYVFIEWPEIVESILPPETVHISIFKHNTTERSVKIVHNE